MNNILKWKKVRYNHWKIEIGIINLSILRPYEGYYWWTIAIIDINNSSYDVMTGETSSLKEAKEEIESYFLKPSIFYFTFLRKENIDLYSVGEK